MTRLRRRPYLLLIACGIWALVGCAPAAAPTPDRPPQTDATPTPLPPPDGWTPAAAPILLGGITGLRELGTLTVPEPPSTVFAHALSLDNTRLYGLNNDNLIGWDLLTGEGLFAVPREDATRLFVSPDRRRIYTVVASGLIRVYASDTGAPIENFRGIDTYNGVAAYDPLSGMLALGGSDGAVQVWDVPARAALATLRGTSAPITSLIFSPDAQAVLVADQNGTLMVWDITTRQIQTTADLARPIYALLYTPQGEFVLVDTPDGTLYLSTTDLSVIGGLAQAPNAGIFAFAGDSSILMHGGGSAPLTLWNTETGTLAATLPDAAAERVSAAASPDGTILFAGALGDGASLWNLSNVATGTVLRGALRVEDAEIREIVWTNDGYQVLFFSTRGPIRVWGIGG